PPPQRAARRERFDTPKLLGGLERAANKRPVSSEQLEELSESIAAGGRRAGPAVGAGPNRHRGEGGRGGAPRAGQASPPIPPSAASRPLTRSPGSSSRPSTAIWPISTRWPRRS